MQTDDSPPFQNRMPPVMVNIEDQNAKDITNLIGSEFGNRFILNLAPKHLKYNPVSDIEKKLGPKMSVKYYLYIGEQKDQIHPLFLRIPANITVLDMMRLASEADPKYKFQAQKSIKGKLYIYEIFGIANDPEDEKFWLLHIGSGNSSIHLTTKVSPDEVYLKNNDKVVMWYKSAKIN
ncbi:uncharacterized protein CG3556 [Caerostris extrusa]|uniref:Uncharacterized protein CG3556 n=1 Tax=Caerostris extrusa TaxID=172846 RepID=A0AAV4NA09_CAEEX|nr:uncharacterized protein CG3556 [Caerostris extrusa]